MTDAQYNSLLDLTTKIAANTTKGFEIVFERLDAIDQRLDRLEGEVRLQRSALEQFGLMKKREHLSA